MNNGQSWVWFIRIVSLAAAVVLGAGTARAQLTFDIFVDPHTVVSGGTIGFTFAGDKFVGSVQKDGFGVLYETDLKGSNLKVFAPTTSIPSGSPAQEHSDAQRRKQHLAETARV